MEFNEKALKYNKGGKIQINGKVTVKNQEDLSLAYTPGVAEPSKEIARDKNKVYDYTNKSNTVAVISDGSAVLGLGDIGPEASMPVMEGKSLLFKLFAGIDAYPLCINQKDPEKITELIKATEPTYGGINLEDITAPKCFEIEKKLKKTMNIPVFHDDQHGTAIIVLGAVYNALEITEKNLKDIKIVVNGAGASGIAITKILLDAGAQNIIQCDSKGTIYKGRETNMNKYKKQIANKTNPENIKGNLKKSMKNADLFIGLSVPNVVNKKMIRNMAENPIVFPMANPEPEIYPEKAKEAGAKIVGSGRSDYPNQINNVLGFPGIFRGALDIRAQDINEEMKIAAAKALADLAKQPILKKLKKQYPDEDLKGFNENYIIPKPLDPRVVPKVAEAVAQAGIKTGVARKKPKPGQIEQKTKKLTQKNRLI
ncbi:malic enzyme-like NAD(P)-binding protein [Methanonatronarchaeum sp. AMET-Sl]|uniref:NAD(P)-dependent malic enzyme n=1 Tax=Methanonatronarchaeum sp. AMET-Sl TaxID=3037654 RepID=UPI00244E4845|nr:malic enzyme-like NAD(P)-binding protein [Methanonatronarchaeum sp. AMET-Sl]WGI17861.1 malic enzyme-like NAD(P)-binding protein [Methanonatronarchaeum sp. AMET-Sl]